MAPWMNSCIHCKGNGKKSWVSTFVESPCEYFQKEYGKNVCYGTKEKDEVSCNGDTDKCQMHF